MRTHQRRWKPGQVLEVGEPPSELVFAFGTRSALERVSFEDVAAAFPGASLLGCSTAGEIEGARVSDDAVIFTSVHFEHTRVRVAERVLTGPDASADVGRALARELAAADLVHVFVLSDGLKVNGSALAQGLAEVLPSGVHATGGLSADGAAFQKTLVVQGSSIAEGRVAAVGFYGTRLQVGFGSVGGWDAFGPDREVTRSEGNVVFELDGKSALGLYKKYLGEHAAGLPASGLLFPLSVRVGDGAPVVRTLLAVDEAAQSVTFAGDVPQGSWARLMKANFDRLIEGAQTAAGASRRLAGPQAPDLALLVSCVGRKLVLQQRVEEELESVREVVGPSTTMAGFYSYGEICPSAPRADCQLHNQTMTVTTFTES